MGPGVAVEVWCRYEGRWVPGYDAVEVVDGRVWVRRHSDGARLPVAFEPTEVREQVLTPVGALRG
jgi:hypothetical protein